MAQYHFTDQLGQAVTGAKKAAAEAAEQLVALDEELAAERESHRAGTLRLVERAEDAERKLAIAEERAAGWDSAAARAQERVGQLEDQVVGYQQSLAQERDARRDAEDQRDDAERAQRLAEDRATTAERELAQLKTAVEALMAHLAPWELPAGIGPQLSEVIRLARS
jgi:chromosome segregation ATPase